MTQEEIDIGKIEQGHYNSDYFKDLPIERKTERVCLAAIRHNSANIEYMAEECKSDLLIYTMLQSLDYKIDEKKGIEDNLIKLIEDGDGYLFNGMPDRVFTPEICWKLVDRGGIWYLKYIPPQKLTEEMCMKAVTKVISSNNAGNIQPCLEAIKYSSPLLEFLKVNGKNLGAFEIFKGINPEFINSEIANEGLKQDLRCLALISEKVPYTLPEKMTNEEKWSILAIAKDRNNYLKLGEDKRTELVSFVAVSADPDLLEDVPDKSRSRRVIYSAIFQNGETIKYLKHDQITHGMLVTAMKNVGYYGGEIFGLFPSEMRTHKRCLEAVKNSGFAIEFVPDEHKTLDVWENAVGSLTSMFDDDSFGILYFMNRSDIFLKLLPDLVREFDLFSMLTVVPQEIINKEVAEWIVNSDGRCFHFLPKELQTSELLNKAINLSGSNVLMYKKNIKPELITERLCKEGMKKEATFFHVIPLEMRTPELCLLQHTLYPCFFKYNSLPKNVANSSNVFTIYTRVEEKTGIQLSLKQACRLLSGETVILQRDKKEPSQRQVIKYDLTTRKLSIHDVVDSPSIKKNTKPKPKLR